MRNLLLNIGKKSRKALLSQIDTSKKNKVLKDYSNLINKNKKLILKENLKDVKNAHRKKNRYTQKKMLLDGRAWPGVQLSDIFF